MTIITVTSEKQPRLQAGSVVTSNYKQIPNPSVMNVGVKDKAAVVGIATHHSQSQILDSQQNVDPSRMGICVAGVATVNPMVLGAAAPIPIGVRLYPEWKKGADSEKDRVLLKRARDENEHHFRCRSLGVRRRISGKVIVESSSFPITKESVARGVRARTAASLERSLSESTLLEARKNQVEKENSELKRLFTDEGDEADRLIDQVQAGQFVKEQVLRASIAEWERKIAEANTETATGVLVKYYYPQWINKAQKAFNTIRRTAESQSSRDTEGVMREIAAIVNDDDLTPGQKRKKLSDMKVLYQNSPMLRRTDVKAMVVRGYIQQWISAIESELTKLDGGVKGPSAKGKQRKESSPQQQIQQLMQPQADPSDIPGPSTGSPSVDADDASWENLKRLLTSGQVEQADAIINAVAAKGRKNYDLIQLREIGDGIGSMRESMQEKENPSAQEENLLTVLRNNESLIYDVVREINQDLEKYRQLQDSEYQTWYSDIRERSIFLQDAIAQQEELETKTQTLESSVQGGEIDGRSATDLHYLIFKLNAIKEYIEKLRNRQEQYRNKYEESIRGIGNLSDNQILREIAFNPSSDDVSSYNAFQQLEVPFQEEYVRLLRAEKERRLQAKKDSGTETLTDAERERLNQKNPVTFAGKTVVPGAMKEFLQNYMKKISNAGVSFVQWRASNYKTSIEGKSLEFYDIETPCSLWNEGSEGSTRIKRGVTTYIGKTFPSNGGVTAMSKVFESIKEMMDKELGKYEKDAVKMQEQRSIFDSFWNRIIVQDPGEDSVKAIINKIMTGEFTTNPEDIRRLYQRACAVTILHHLYAVRNQVVMVNKKGQNDSSKVEMIARMLGRTLTDTCRYLDNLKYLSKEEQTSLSNLLSTTAVIAANAANAASN